MSLMLAIILSSLLFNLIHGDDRVCVPASGTQLEPIPETTVSDWSTSRLSSTASCGYVVDDNLSDGRVLSLGSCSSQFDYPNGRRISYRYDCDESNNLKLRIWNQINAKRFCRNAEFDLAIYDETVTGLNFLCGDTCASIWTVVEHDSCANLIQTRRIEYAYAIESCYTEGSNSFIRTCGVDDRSFVKDSICNMDDPDLCNRANALWKFSNTDCSGTPTEVVENLVQQYEDQLCCSNLNVDGLEVLPSDTVNGKKDFIVTEARCRWDTRPFTRPVYPFVDSKYQTREHDLILFLQRFNNYFTNNDFQNQINDFCVERDCNLGNNYNNRFNGINTFSFIPEDDDDFSGDSLPISGFPDITKKDFWPDLQYDEGFFRVSGEFTSTTSNGCTFETDSTFLVFYNSTDGSNNGDINIVRVYSTSQDIAEATQYFDNANTNVNCGSTPTSLETTNIDFSSCVNSAYNDYDTCISNVSGLKNALNAGVTDLVTTLSQSASDDYDDCVDDFEQEFEDCVNDR